MRTCVYTAVTRGYDPLRPHPEVDGVDWVAFVDDRRWSHGEAPERNGWQLRDMMFGASTPRMRAKFYKVNPSAVLKDYDRSVWVDASVEVRNAEDLVDLMTAWDLTLFPHPERDCIYEEALASLDMPKYAGEPVLEQVAKYRRLGHPSHWGLWAGTVIGRRHNVDAVDNLMNLWWRHINDWSVQDQLSLPFLLRQQRLQPATVQGPCLYDNDMFTAHFQPEAT